MPSYIFPATTRRYVFAAKDGDMPCGSFAKDPTEQFLTGIDWTRRLPSGRSLGMVSLTATDCADNSAAPAVLVSPTGTTSGMITFATVRAGAVGHRYKIIFDLTDDANGHYRQALIMIVRSA